MIHFAAYAYVGESMTDPGKYFRNNVAGTINLLDAMVAAGVRDLVFSSTCATYGEPRRGSDLREPSPESGQRLRRDQAGRRARCCAGTARPRPPLRGAALLQRRRRRSRWRHRRGPLPGDAPHPAGDRGGAWSRRAAVDLRNRLPDARRHGGAGLHPRPRSGRGAPAGAGHAGEGTATPTSLHLNLGTGRAARCER